MFKEAASSIFQIGNFFDELCIVDQEGMIHFYQVCSTDGTSVLVDSVIGRNVRDVFAMLQPESNEILQALSSRKTICTFHEYCLNYKGEAYPGYVSVFPIRWKKEFAGLAIALKFLTPDYSEEVIQIRDHSYRRKRYDDAYTIDDIITCDEGMNRIKDKIRKVSRRDSTVLIQGNTGTGKELVAQAIHYLSPRATGPFIAQNCSAIPANLLESTLFGTEKGSFTGAVTNQGLLELAGGGTLFLDEINSMSTALQSKILTAIETRTVRHLGGHENIRINVRIICAINEDPFEAIEKHRLRSDLYYRLNVVNFRLPELAQRQGDIEYLTEYYIKYYNEQFGMEIKGISQEVKALFRQHSWPGNVRELKNVIEGAFNIAESDYIRVEDLPEYFLESHGKKQTPLKESELFRTYEEFQDYLRQLEQSFLRQVVSDCHTKAEAAYRLKITPQTLNYRLHRLDQQEKNMKTMEKE